jgi:transcriptional regulator with PAS, ATPase and Fis domain
MVLRDEHRLAKVSASGLLAIIDSLREGVLAVDADLHVFAMNKAAVDLLGQDLAALAGRPVCELFGTHACPRDSLEETIRSGQVIMDFQTTLQLADGSLGHVLLRTVPLAGGEGPPGEGPGGVALVLGDVTEVTSLRKQIDVRERFGRIVGRNARMQQLYRLIEDVAPSDASVLVRGESGTGKELVARAIHLASGRADGPFVQVNCSALSEGLLESELFGHVRGAFTGAVANRRGRFEEAHGGTIFLDEIGDVSPVVQVKLLRVLQERVIERVGDNRPIPVNVRIISATNRDLERLLAGGRIREDFYYRIKVVSLEVPPLRQRREDIPALCAHFLSRLRGRQIGSDELDTVLAPETLALLLQHDWPGNVRELENALEHAQVLSRGGRILAAHLPPEITRHHSSGPLRSVPRHSQREEQLLDAALRRHGWNRTRAARDLGIDRTTLWRKIREYGLTPPD